MKRTAVMRLLPIVSSAASLLNIVLYMIDRNVGEEGQGGTISAVVGYSWLCTTVLAACSIVYLVVKVAMYPKAAIARKVVILNLTSLVLYCLFFVFTWVFPPAFRGV